jgi:hypothetical protein
VASQRPCRSCHADRVWSTTGTHVFAPIAFGAAGGPGVGAPRVASKTIRPMSGYIPVWLPDVRRDSTGEHLTALEAAAVVNNLRGHLVLLRPKYSGPRMDGWVPQKRFAKHAWTFLHPELDGPDETISCDEFPFSATYQSPGVPVANGGENTAGVNGGAECIQTVAAKVDDGSEHLLDDTRYDAPTFDETCGRSSMSLTRRAST